MKTNYYEKMKEVWKIANDALMMRPGFRDIAQGQITIEGYKEVLRQIFHHARENPQIQSFATAYFRGEQRKTVSTFFKHATSEIGHDQLALDDLAALGGDVKYIPVENPLPETTALVAYAYYQIQFRNPVGYLGYLFFLEFTPTQNGAKYLEMFKAKGVPESALTFLEEHATVDVSHCKLMERYVNDLIQSDADFEEVAYAIQTTATLYGRMVEASVANAAESTWFGISSEEARRSPKMTTTEWAKESNAR